MNKMFPRFLVAVASLAMLASNAPAEDHKGNKANFYNEVTAVDDKSITLYQTPTKSVTYTITGETKITVDHKPGKISDIKTGMKVTMVNHKPDSNEATSIIAESVKMGRRGKGY